MEPLPLPFALSLSKCPCIVSLSNELSLSKCRAKGFDKLSPTGVLIILSLSKDQLSPISALQHARH
jgi:hypothetical protein